MCVFHQKNNTWDLNVNITWMGGWTLVLFFYIKDDSTGQRRVVRCYRYTKPTNLSSFQHQEIDEVILGQIILRFVSC